MVPGMAPKTQCEFIVLHTASLDLHFGGHLIGRHVDGDCNDEVIYYFVLQAYTLRGIICICFCMLSFRTKVSPIGARELCASLSLLLFFASSLSTYLAISSSNAPRGQVSTPHIVPIRETTHTHLPCTVFIRRENHFAGRSIERSSGEHLNDYCSWRTQQQHTWFNDLLRS